MRRPPTVLFAVIALLGVAPAAAANDQGLTIVEPDKVVFTSTDGSTKPVSVWVSNATSGAVTPAFKLVAEKDDGSLLGDEVTVKADDPVAPVAVGAVGHYRIHVEGAGADTDAAGQLVAQATGATPGTVDASIGPEPNLVAGTDDPLWIPIVISVVLLVAGLIIADAVTSATNTIPIVKIDFGASFATTLTTVGAVLGTVLAAGVLPEQTTTLSKEAFTALNVLFGIAVVIGAAIPAVGQRRDQTNTIIGLFWLGALITMWAVYGELITLWLLVGELGSQQGFSDWALTAFRVLLGFGAVAMAFYAALRIAAVTTESDKSADDKAASQLFAISAQQGTQRTPAL